jgi:D-xylose transport system permease protein
MTQTENQPVASSPDPALAAAPETIVSGEALRRVVDPRRWLVSGGSRTLPLLALLVVMWVGFDLKTGGIYLSSQNVTDILVYTSLYGLVAIGEVVVLLLGEIDLSLGSLVGVSGASAALIMANWVPQAPTLVTMLVGVAAAAAVGVASGLFAGFWVSVMRVPSFIVTLALLLALTGIGLVLTNSQTITVTNDLFNALGASSTSALDGGYLSPALWGSHKDVIHLSAGMLVVLILGLGYTLVLLGNARVRVASGLAAPSAVRLLSQGLAITVIGLIVVDILDHYQGVPLPVFFLFVFLIMFSYLLRATRFGRHVYATGGNAEAARRAGISIRRIRWAAFVLSGLMAGLGGAIYTARNNANNGGTVDQSFLLLVIASAVIGGTSLFGGRGSVWSALTGALVLSSVQTGMALTLTATTNAQYFQYIVEGAILLGVAWLDTYARSRSAGSREA